MTDSNDKNLAELAVTNPEQLPLVMLKLMIRGLTLKIANDVQDAIDNYIGLIEELESTRGVLRFWESQLRAMVWNTENEDGSMIKVMDKPHKIALKIADFEDEDISKAVHFPATRRELLDKLQVRVIVFRDRIEVKAVFPIEPIYCHKCTSP